MGLASGTVVQVAGGGIFGLACAWELTRRGIPVRVAEARTVGAGASGGHVGALSPHAPDNWTPKKELQLQSLLAAPGFWAGVEDASGLPTGFGRTGRVQPVTDMAQIPQLRARIAASAERWPAAARMALTQDPDGMAVASPTGWWLTDGMAARLNPRAALAALAGAIRARGGTVAEGAPADPGTAPTLWATGTEGLEALNDALGRRIGQGVKGQSLLLALDRGDAPQVFADGIYVVPHADGTVAVGSTSERDFADPRSTDARLDAVIEAARAACPALRDAPVVERWVGLRPRARSRAPMLGEWPGRPGHFIANGGFKIGFGMAPKIAQIIADLMLDGRDSVPPMFRLT